MGTQQPALDPVTPYRYVGGDPSIDFVNTVDWTGRGRECDRFTSYARLIEWAEGAHALAPSVLGALRRAAKRDGYEAERVVREAVELRTLLERAFFGIAGGGHVDAELAELSQGWLRRSLAQIAVSGERGAAGGRGFVFHWPRAAQALESPLWSVAWSAARLLTSDDVARIRRCGGIDCGWYYIDRSRNGLRRWCEMETCGTVMKSYRRAERNTRARERATGAPSASGGASRERR